MHFLRRDDLNATQKEMNGAGIAAVSGSLISKSLGVTGRIDAVFQGGKMRAHTQALVPPAHHQIVTVISHFACTVAQPSTASRAAAFMQF